MRDLEFAGGTIGGRSRGVQVDRVFLKTKSGAVHLGNSLDFIAGLPEQSVDLIMTSPPFGLVRKKITAT